MRAGHSHHGSPRHARSRAARRSVAAGVVCLIMAACGIGGGEPAITVPHEVTRAGQLALRITKDTPQRLAWDVVCLGTGRYSKVAVHERSATSKGTYSGSGAECERAGQRVLSGEMAKRGSVHDGDLVELSLEAVPADGVGSINAQGFFTVGSDGRLSPR